MHLPRIAARAEAAAWWRPRLRRRARAAAGRLEAARHGFERSVVALRTAALDHVDSQDLASLALRLCLDRRRCRAEGTAAGIRP